MRACEARGVEIMESTSQLSASAAESVRVELASLADALQKRQTASLVAAHADAEAVERALVAPSVREKPKHEQLLASLQTEMAQALQLALARPAEWFEILSRQLKLEEAAVRERDERLRAATYHHAAELSAQHAAGGAPLEALMRLSATLEAALARVEALEGGGGDARARGAPHGLRASAKGSRACVIS